MAKDAVKKAPRHCLISGKESKDLSRCRRRRNGETCRDKENRTKDCRRCKCILRDEVRKKGLLRPVVSLQEMRALNAPPTPFTASNAAVCDS